MKGEFNVHILWDKCQKEKDIASKWYFLLVVLVLGMCLCFEVASHDKYLLNSLPKIDSPPFQLLKW